MDLSPHSTPQELADLANARPDLHTEIAAHPAAYSALLTWIADTSPDPAARQAAAQRLAPPAPPAPPAQPAQSAQSTQVSSPPAPGYTGAAQAQAAPSKPRGRGKLIGAIAAFAVIVLVAVGAFWFLGREDSSPSIPPYSLSLDEAPVEIVLPSSEYSLRAVDPYAPYLLASRTKPESNIVDGYFVLTLDGAEVSEVTLIPEFYGEDRSETPYAIVDGTVYFTTDWEDNHVFTWNVETQELSQVESPDEDYVFQVVPIAPNHSIITTSPDRDEFDTSTYTVSSVKDGKVQWTFTKEEAECSLNTRVDWLQLAENNRWLRCPTLTTAINLETGAAVTAPENTLFILASDGAVMTEQSWDDKGNLVWRDFRFYDANGDQRDDIELSDGVYEVESFWSFGGSVSEWVEGMRASATYATEHPDSDSTLLTEDGKAIGFAFGEVDKVNTIEIQCDDDSVVLLADHGDKLLCISTKYMQAFDISEGVSGQQLWSINGMFDRFRAFYYPFNGSQWIVGLDPFYLIEE
ncbi:MAG: hypothetical protein Q4P33_09670 [Flaviflexus sp.]|nr:hypothetical protein [Flaviflexus sp.]